MREGSALGGFESITPELQVIAQRLDEIEKEIARLAVSVIEQSNRQRTVVARGFVVRDAQGHRRATLGMAILQTRQKNSHGSVSFDANGNLRAGVGIGWLELYDEKPRSAVEVMSYESGPRVALFNTNGKPNASVAVSEHGPYIMLCSPHGEQRLSLEVLASGAPGLVIFDANGETRLKLALDNDGPSLKFGKDKKRFWSAL